MTGSTTEGDVGEIVPSTFFTFNITPMGVAWQETTSADLCPPTPLNVPSVADMSMVVEPFADEKQSLFVAMVTLLRGLNGGGHGPCGELFCCPVGYLENCQWGEGNPKRAHIVTYRARSRRTPPVPTAKHIR